MRNQNLNNDKENLTPTDKEIEKVLRPQGFDEFSGQDKIVENLVVFIQAAKQRGEALDHVLLHGPPGLGKTTLSHIIANELGVSMRVTSGPVIEKAGDLAGLLTNLQPNDVLFIDEIHRMQTTVEEYLYSAMEDFKLDIMLGKGPSARSLRIRASADTGTENRPLLSTGVAVVGRRARVRLARGRRGRRRRPGSMARSRAGTAPR